MLQKRKKPSEMWKVGKYENMHKTITNMFMVANVTSWDVTFAKPKLWT